MNKMTVLSIGAFFILFAGSMMVSSFAVDPTVNLYPDFSASPSTDTGCVALTSTVSHETGGLSSSSPATGGSGYIDQEDTSYSTNQGGASFCSYQFTGSTLSLTSASATLYLYTSGSTTDVWPTTVSLVDLTSCTTYSSSTPCPTVASGEADLTGVPNGEGCSSAASFPFTLTLSASAALTSGDLYGVIVSTTSSSDNGYSNLNLCTGPLAVGEGGGSTVLTLEGTTSTTTTTSSTTTTSTATGVPEFPLGAGSALLLIAAISVPVLLLFRKWNLPRTLK